MTPMINTGEVFLSGRRCVIRAEDLRRYCFLWLPAAWSLALTGQQTAVPLLSEFRCIPGLHNYCFNHCHFLSATFKKFKPLTGMGEEIENPII